MARLLTHLTWYAAMNGFLIALWTLTAGSLEGLQRVATDPSSAIEVGFWPIWPILMWGTLVLIHAGTTVSNLLFGSRAVRRRRRIAREAAETGKEIAREVGGALDKAHERRSRRRGRSGDVQVAPVAAPERRWVTVLFCDISDSTAHNEQLGDEEWHKVLSAVRGTVRRALAEREGKEVGTSGDGMLARFTGPADAVLCAIDIQSELTDARSREAFVPEVRIGIHAGEVVEEEGDLVGRVINLASRVTDEAEPGQIWVTEPVADQLVGKLELEDRGLRELKGMTQPRHLLSVKWG